MEFSVPKRLRLILVLGHLAVLHGPHFENHRVMLPSSDVIILPLAYGLVQQ